MDNVLIVVDDLEAAKAFFIELGLKLEGETIVEGPLVGRLIGLEDVRATLAMMRTPDGQGIELDKFHTPKAIRFGPVDAPVNTLGIRRVMFAVDDIDAVVAHMRAHGAELIGEMQYEDTYRLAYIRGPEGIIVGLAEQLGQGVPGVDRRGNSMTAEDSMTEHSHLATIRRYYDGCNRPDVELMESTFATDVVHYFTNLPPIRGATNLAKFFAAFHSEWQAQWTVDHGIAERDEAVVEWTLRCVPPGRSQPELIRGAEWYLFRAGKIAEIRAYYVGHETIGFGKYELDGFPYAERGYPILAC